MPVASKHQLTAKPGAEPRAVLGPAGNRLRVSEEPKRKSESLNSKTQLQPRKPAPEVAVSAVRDNVSVDTVCSSDSSSSSNGSSAKLVKLNKATKRIGAKPVKLVRNPSGADAIETEVKDLGQLKRCEWITNFSDPLYTAFHDEEWGVPVHDDKKLVELLVFSQALAELSWPSILHKRDIFREHFDGFSVSSIAQFDEKKLLSLKVNGSPLLSEPKLRAVLENAKQIVKIQKEFGSFSNYCWSFVMNKPLRNGHRYGRQVPVKTPKAEVISKNLMQRGFCCVGPTVIYSFMQSAGIVNDHLVSCFRYQDCNPCIKGKLKPENKDARERKVASGESK